MDLSQVRAICEAAVREYGVPARIRTDIGTPFAGTGLLGLSKLSLGWMKLGIVHERIQAGRPQQNGHHERIIPRQLWVFDAYSGCSLKLVEQESTAHAHSPCRRRS